MDGTTQIGIRAVFALIILLVALAEGVGAEYILGAFLAGVVVSLLNPDEEMVEKLDSFGYGFFYTDILYYGRCGLKYSVLN